MRRLVAHGLTALLVALGFAKERQRPRIEAFKARLRLRRKWMLIGVAAFIALAGAAGAFTAIVGLPVVKASSGHWAITEWVLQNSKQRSVSLHSMNLTAPELDDERLVLIGAGHYESGCRFCHGAPGMPQPRVPQAMLPRPPPMVEAARKYTAEELFYIVKHGLKFAGMPAWPAQEREDEVWPVVAFILKTPGMDEAAYRALVFGAELETPTQAPPTVTRVCARCHGADGLGRGRAAFPKLAGQRPEYLRRSLQAYASGERHSGIMEPIAVSLRPEELESAVRWYASLPPFTSSSAKGSKLGEALATHGDPARKLPPCIKCHGPKQAPRYPVYPRLAGQYAEYLELQLTLFKEGRRGGTEYAEIMKLVASHGLTEEEMKEVARYFASMASSVESGREE